ncbi:pentafunctional AROM polypeptide, putative [Plasmodium berghei]|uniref:Pentafunctional AROM polypeptide, putative n=2 Tax=Plasmodium berghei TaxID=5821 RepID=A0A122HSS0_PLABE|nr:pentafunctional AROM polypeptide, putative [Plasmodium berghei]
MQEVTLEKSVSMPNTFREYDEFGFENIYVENTISPFFESFQLKRNDHGNYIIITDYKLLLKIKKYIFKIIAFLLNNKENEKSSLKNQTQNILNTSGIITQLRKKNDHNDVKKQKNIHTTYTQLDTKNYEQVMQNVIENRQIGDKNQHKNLARQEKNVYNENILNEKYKNIIKEIINNDKINTFEIENVLIVVTRIQKKYQKVDKLEEFIEILKKIPISSQSEIFVFLNKYMIYILQILHDHFKVMKIYAFPLSISSAITMIQEISRISNNPILIYIAICLLLPLNKKEYTFGLAEALKFGILNDKKLYIKIKEKDLKYFRKRLKYIIYKCIKNRENVIKKMCQKNVNYMNILNFGNIIGNAIKSVFDQITTFENYKNEYNIYGIYYELKILNEINKINMLLFLDIEQVMTKYKLNYKLNQNFLNYYTKDIITFLHKTYCSKENNKIPIIHLTDINKIKPDIIVNVPLSIFYKVLSPIVSISMCSNFILSNIFHNSQKREMININNLNFLFIKNVGNKSETIRAIYTSCMSMQSVILRNINLCFDVVLFIKILKDLKFNICLKKKTKKKYKTIFDKIYENSIETYKCEQYENYLSITGNIDKRNSNFLFKNFIFQDKIIFNVYNSGTVCRLILPLLCLYICKQNLKAKKENKKLLKFIILKGNEQMECLRIISPLVKVIQKSFKYIKIIYLKKKNYLPIQISVKIEKLKNYDIFLSNNIFINNSASSQFVSSMLLISPFSETNTCIHLLYKRIRNKIQKKYYLKIYRNKFFKIQIKKKVNYYNSLINVSKKNIYRKSLNPKELSNYKCIYNKVFLKIVYTKKDKQFDKTQICAKDIKVCSEQIRNRQKNVISVNKSNNILKKLNKTYFETTSKSFIDLTVNIMKLWGVKVCVQNYNYIIKNENILSKIHLLYKRIRNKIQKKYYLKIYRNKFFKIQIKKKVNYYNSLINVSKKNIYRKSLNPKELSNYKCIYNKVFLKIVYTKKDKQFDKTQICAKDIKVCSEQIRNRQKNVISVNKSNNILKKLNKTYFETTSKSFIDLTVNIMKLWGVKVCVQNYNYIIKNENILSKKYDNFAYFLVEKKKKKKKKSIQYHKKSYWKNICRYTYSNYVKLNRYICNLNKNLFMKSIYKNIVNKIKYYKLGVKYEQTKGNDYTDKKNKNETVLDNSCLNNVSIIYKPIYRICNDLGLYFYFIVGCIIKKINCSFVLNLCLNNIIMKKISSKYYKIKYFMIQKNVQNYFLLNLLLLLGVDIYIKIKSARNVRLYLFTSKGINIRIKRQLYQYYEKNKKETNKIRKVKYHPFEKIYINYYFNNINKVLIKIVIDAESFSDDFFPICVLFCYYIIIHKTKNILFKIKNIHNQDIKESIRINNVVYILKLCFQNLVLILCDKNSIYITRIRSYIDNCIFNLNRNKHYIDTSKIGYKKNVIFYNNSKYILNNNNILYLFIDTKNDHRIIFMTTILSLIFRNILIDNCFQIKKSYPEFYKHVNEYLQINLNYATSFELKFNHFIHFNNYNILNEHINSSFSGITNNSEIEIPQNENYMRKYKYKEIIKNDINICYLLKEINRLNINIICGIRNVGKSFLGKKIENSFVIDIDDYVFEKEIKFDKIKINDFRYYEYLTFISVLYMSYCILAYKPCSKGCANKTKIRYTSKYKQIFHKVDNLYFFISNDVIFYNKKINDLYKNIKHKINQSNNNYINNISIILGGGIIEFENSRNVINKLKNVTIIKRDKYELYEICINDKIKPKLSGNLIEIIEKRTIIFNELNIPFHFSIPTEYIINKNIKNLNKTRNNLIVASFLNFFNYKFYVKPIINPKLLFTQIISINLNDFHLFNYKSMESNYEYVELIINEQNESQTKNRSEINEKSVNFPSIDFELLNLAIFIIRAYTSKPIIIKLSKYFFCHNFSKSMTNSEKKQLEKINLNYLINIFYKYKINIFDIDIKYVDILEEQNENCFFIISKNVNEINKLQKYISIVNMFYVGCLKLSFHLFSKKNKELLNSILNEYYKDRLKNKSLQSYNQYIKKNGEYILLYNIESKYNPFSAFLYNQITNFKFQKSFLTNLHKHNSKKIFQIIKQNESQILYSSFMYTHYYTNCIIAICYSSNCL